MRRRRPPTIGRVPSQPPALAWIILVVATLMLMAAVLRPVSPPSAREVAHRILATSRITLATTHADSCDNRLPDGADARSNVSDSARGLPARRSSHGTAPGGSIDLNPAMLEGMLDQAATYTFTVAEIAGGSHPVHSRHYAGLAFDVDTIGGRHVRASGLVERQFMDGCRANGATEVLYEIDHIHCGWPT